MSVLVFFGRSCPVFSQDRPDVFGVGTASGGWTLLDPPGYEPAMWDTLAHVNAASTRNGASWPQIEPVRGSYDWSDLDAEVALCLSRGITPYCLIVNTPAWASPTGEETHAWPPLEEYAPDFEAFCATLASRYAGQINHFEFWNEENGYGWHEFNRADEYVPWLRRAYNALKVGNPDCMVSIGGMDDPDIDPGDPTGWRGAYYLNLVYYYRDLWYPGEEIFDAVADHPYCRKDVFQDLPAKLQAIRQVLEAHNDGHKPLWLTEYGWSTAEDGWTHAKQAQYLHDYLTVLTDPAYAYVNQHVTQASYLAIGDFGTGREGFGLCDQNLRPKPAFYTFQGFPRCDAPQISRVSWRPVDWQTVEVSWETHIPSTSQAEYGVTAAYGSETALDPTLVTQHAVLVSGLSAGTEYHFRALSTAPGVPDSSSPDYRFRCADGTVPNGGFEDGFGPGIGEWWTTFGRPACTDGWVFDPPRLHSGQHAQVLVVIGHWGQEYMDYGLYTQVAIVPGREYTFAAWTRLETGTAGNDKVYRKVGTDPTGGTDPDSPDVVWSTENYIEDAWAQMSVSATAQAAVSTVFVRAEVVQQISDVYYWLYVDDADVVVEPAPLVRPEPGTLVFQDGRQYPDQSIYSGTRDAHIIQNRPLYNTGGGDVLEAARHTGSDAGHDRSIVIKFVELDTSLEAGKYLQQAILTLDYFGSRNGPGGVDKTLYVHKLLHDWGEGTQTGIDGEWAGANEVCWTKPYGATNGDNPNWNGTLDAQYADPVALDSATLAGPDDYGPVSFGVTEAVREHLADPSQNFGFVIREEEGSESTQDGTRQFRSREYAGTGTDADVLDRPSLTLTFVDQPPPVNIESVASLSDHGVAGQLGLDVNLAAATLPDDSALVTTESRQAGITKLAIGCDGEVTLPDPPENLVVSIVGVNNGDVTANVASVTAIGDVVTISLNPLPDQDTYTVTLAGSVIAGDNDFLIRALEGEVDNAGVSAQVVNALDLSEVRMNFGADVTVGNNAKYDIVSDGAINALDLSQCRTLFAHAAP